METFVATFLKMSGINLLRYFIIAGIPFALFYLLFPEKVQRFKIQTKNALTSDFVGEILHSLQTAFVFGFISLIVLYTPFADLTRLYRDLDAFPLWWIPVSLMLSLVFHDTYFYWMHRLMHVSPLYKYVHLVHHKSTNPSPWASYSFHFLEAIVEGMVVVPLLFLIPMHPITLGLFILFGFMINVYGHLGFEILPESFRKSILFKLLNTSVYHNLHHSQVHGNYSLYFRHWDVWMKTENKNYEPYFEKVLERRKKSATVEPSSSFLKKSFFSVLLILSATTLFGQVEGKWKMEEREAVVEIYKKDNLYYCKVVDAGNPLENQVLHTREVLLFSGMKKQSATKWCCGNIIHPYRNIEVEGVAELVEKGRLKIYSPIDPEKKMVYFKRI